jgi:nicotinamidase-related amidase
MQTPVVVTEQQKLGATLPEIRSEVRDGEPMVKVDFNCFGLDLFTRRVRDLHKKALILAGIEAHICVAQTALHGVSEYIVHVVGDATSSRSVHNRDIALQRMRESGVTITSSEMVIYELLGKAGTETFREVLKLVK